MHLRAAMYFISGCPLMLLRRRGQSSLIRRLPLLMRTFQPSSNLRAQVSQYFGSVNGMVEELPGQQERERTAAADRLRPRPLLRKCIDEAPDEPGVYSMESASGRKLYIGKSVKLSSRVPTYFRLNSGGRNDAAASTVDAAVLPGPNLARRIEVMTTLVERIDYIVTASGAEALLLEASMIKHHQPLFNVLLKDDKRNYPYVCVTWSEPYPRLLVTRDRPRRGGGPEDRYYGPFVDQGQVKATVALIRRVLPLRERKRPLYKDKPCLNYDIGLCPGACQGLISEDEYAETVRLAEMVFRGEGGELMSRLRDRMQSASDAEEFERADEIKSQIVIVQGGLLGSALHFSSDGAAAGGRGLTEGVFRGKAWRKKESDELKRDVVAVGQAGHLACFQVFQVRGSRLTGRLGFTYRVEEGLSRGEVLQACLERYWGDTLEASTSRGVTMESKRPSSSSPEFPQKRGMLVADLPDEIVTADELPEGGAVLLEELLSEARKATAATAIESKVASTKKIEDGEQPAEASEEVRPPRSASASSRVGKPPRPVVVVHGGEGTGERHHLCVMVAKNAELEATRLLKGAEAAGEGLAQLVRMLGLASVPGRIEGYDISHTGGGQAVASAVCFVDGKASPKDHRKYRIRSPDVRKGHSDDYASLREVIARRFAPPSPQARSSHPGAVPDLVLVDGGKGQLHAALEGAAVAADAWKSVGGDGDGRDECRKALPSLINATDGNAIAGISDAPPPSQPPEAEDPDDVLLSAVPPSDEPPNCRAGAGSAVDVGGGRRVMFVSLAKKDEEVFVPWSSQPLPTAVEAGPNSPGVMLLRQVRDEAHRFAVAYHRKLRGKDMFLPPQDTATAADDEGPGGNGHGGFEGITGLSRKNRKTLVETFGSLQGARIAGEAELRRIPGIGPTLAKRILA